MDDNRHGGARKGAGRKKEKNPRNVTLTFTISKKERERYVKILEDVKNKEKLKSRVEALFFVLDRINF